MEDTALYLLVITLLAATVNGALGYGFSSITVPLALLILSNRVLNPALVLVEVVLNGYMVWVNRSSVPAIWKRVFPIIVGLAPGIVVGTLLITKVSPDWLKLWTFVTLIPLILLQAAGLRRPVKAERTWGALFGGGLGVLYAVTTISGPPLAVVFNNQGLVKREFRSALGVVRLAESTLTAIAYLAMGLFTRESMGLIPFLVPSIVIGVPIGAFIIRHVPAETFRRLCMSFDAWVVGFGCSRLLAALHLVPDPEAYWVLAVVGGIDLVLLVRFFSRPSALTEAALDVVSGSEPSLSR